MHRAQTFLIRFLLLLLACWCGAGLTHVYAQDRTVREDSLVVIERQRDTVLIKSYAARYNPRKALLYAAVLPGLGQIYTKKYWKLPLVYGGLYFPIHYMGVYQRGYTKYKGHLFDNLEAGLTSDSDRNPDTGYTTSQLRTIVSRYRRERDFMIIIIGGIYLLQMVDAHVDAHLKEFDLNPNLRVSIEPMVEQNALLGRQSGVSLIVRF